MSQSPGSRRIQRIVIFAVMASMAAIAAWLWLDTSILAFTLTTQLNYIDGYAVDDILRLARGDALYPHLAAPPYVVVPYTPAYFAVAAAAVTLGADPFVAGRLLVLVSMLVAAVIVTAAGYRRNGWVAILIGLALLLNPLQWPWSLAIRPDMLAVLFAVIAVHLVRGGDRDDRAAVMVASLLCVAAVYSKQTALAAPVIIAIRVFRRDAGVAWRFVGIFVGAGAAIAGVLQFVTNGTFLFHTISANTNPFTVARIVFMYSRFLVSNPLFVAVLVVMVVSAIQRRRLSGIGLYALVSMVTALTVGKIGSSLNYFLEPTVAMSLWAAMEFPRCWFEPPSRVRTVLATAVVVVVGTVAIVSGLQQLRGHAAARTAFPTHANLVARFKEIPGPVICDDATLLAAAGKAVHYRPFIMTQLSDTGLWDQRPFLEELERGEIALIVMRSDSAPLLASRYTREMRDVIARRYRQVFGFRMGAEFAAFSPVEATGQHQSAEGAAPNGEPRQTD